MRAMTDAGAAFTAYEAVRHRLPQTRFPARSSHAGGLRDLFDEADAFLLDAFGVLNVGESSIPGAIETVAALREAGKRVMVVSNAAGYCKRVLSARYVRLGFDLAPEDVVSSRDVVLAELSRRPTLRWGIMADVAHGREGLEHLETQFLEDDPAAYDIAEGFLLLGSGTWTEARQRLLEEALSTRPRPVLVGNPDLVAPRENGLSLEPGYYAHRLQDMTGVIPEFFGKPFANAFEQALAQLAEIPRSRIFMVGDTLQTDILGGANAGLRTVLVTGHGALVGLDPDQAIKTSGIVPDFLLKAV